MIVRRALGVGKMNGRELEWKINTFSLTVQVVAIYGLQEPSRLAEEPSKCVTGVRFYEFVQL